MTFPLKRIAVGLCRLAVGLVFVATVAAPSAADAQSSSTKRAVPPSKARAASKSIVNNASPWVPNPSVSGKTAYLIVDATSGREIYSDQADELRHPASLTKLMTIYLTFSALDSGRLSLGDSLPVSSNALNAPPTKMGLTPGGSVSVRDAAMALITRSANDAAVVLAEALGGDEPSFARTMTQKARQLGMTSTVFRNASGLPNREQVTTARDLARLANALLRDFPHYYAVFSVQSYPYRGRPLDNHNRMLGNYDGADGLKTGYTAASGFNLAMSAMRDNRRLIGVVMGGQTVASPAPSPWGSRRGLRSASHHQPATPPPSSCRARRSPKPHVLPALPRPSHHRHPQPHLRRRPPGLPGQPSRHPPRRKGWRSGAGLSRSDLSPSRNRLSLPLSAPPRRCPIPCARQRLRRSTRCRWPTRSSTARG